jgi:lactoylglutathione lyase
MQANFTYAIRFTADMVATTAFYRDVLGLEVRFETPSWTEFETGDVTLALHPASAEDPPGVVQLGFRTDDVVRLHAEAAQNGLPFTAPPRNRNQPQLLRPAQQRSAGSVRRVMSDYHDLTADERALLRSAMDSPLEDRDPIALGLCLRLCGRRLLQRAGSAAAANGWRGSPHAFVLTREGWSLVKHQRLRGPLRRAG